MTLCPLECLYHVGAQNICLSGDTDSDSRPALDAALCADARADLASQDAQIIYLAHGLLSDSPSHADILSFSYRPSLRTLHTPPEQWHPRAWPVITRVDDIIVALASF